MSSKKKAPPGPPPVPFVIYPGITLPDPKSISIDSQLVSSYFAFNRFWRSSHYHLGDGVPKTEHKSLDTERYSDSLKSKKKKRSFHDLLFLRPDNFPKELLGDAPRERRPVKRAKWRQDADLQKLDFFEKLEAQYVKAQGDEEKEDDDGEGVEEESEGEEESDKAQVKKEKEQGEEGDEVDQVLEEESQAEEESDHGDYDHNQDFDDDDDDYNQADCGKFEYLL